ncbi:MAG: hypothetical protein IJ753_08190 [Bacteroidales bacterium]|nr:hypothetical protein [Bacteroidales bacterium]
MNKMILYKEWLKTRWVLLGIVLVFAAVTFYCFLNLTKVVEIRGGGLLWEAMVEKDALLVDIFRYLPAVAGAFLALAQFVPEVQHKRLKLTLHLPYPQKRMLLVMVAIGLLILTVLYALQAGVSAFLLAQWVPVELVSRVFRTTLVWYLAGWAAYLFTSALCLEPTWKTRVLVLMVASAFLYLLFLSGVPEAYNGFLPWLVAYTLLSGVLLFHGVARFKEGAQD